MKQLDFEKGPKKITRPRRRQKVVRKGFEISQEELEKCPGYVRPMGCSQK